MSYDTNERVDKLVSDVKKGEIISNEEILTHASGDISDLSTLTNIKRKYRRRVRK